MLLALVLWWRCSQVAKAVVIPVEIVIKLSAACCIAGLVQGNLEHNDVFVPVLLAFGSNHSSSPLLLCDQSIPNQCEITLTEQVLE
jgi:hypothetical protein